jgi:DNA-binding transcriptional LysR family regulator
MAFDVRLLGGIGVLAAVVETGNFARAAASMGLTPSGVSRAVARLEERVGVRLFDRTPRAVTLTDDGRRFHAQIAPLLAGLEEATADAVGGAATVRGRLRVNVDPWFARLILAPRLPLLIDRHPGLEIELITRDAIGDLVAEGFDIAVRFGEPEPTGLIARKLLETRIVTVAAPNYLARHGRPKAPADLVGHTCLQFRDPWSGRPFAWEFHRGRKVVSVDTRGPLLVTEAGIGLMACLAGAGIAQVMTLGLGDMVTTGRLVDLFPEWPDETFPLYALHPSRRHVPAKVTAFIDFCREAAATEKR